MEGGRKHGQDVEPHFVAVDARVGTDGFVNPTAIHWDDGRTFVIAGVVGTRPVTVNIGGRCRHALKYTVLIGRNAKELYREGGRWFVMTPIEHAYDELCQLPEQRAADWPATWRR